MKYTNSTELANHLNHFVLGTAMEYQNDDRINFSYSSNFNRDSITLEQTEKIFNLGIYLINNFFILDNLELSAAIRYDYYKFSVDDFLINENNPDQSGKRSFSEFNPKISILFSPIDNLNIYGGFATSFETPTTTEFINNPNDSGGLNPDLDPQKNHRIRDWNKRYFY